MDEDEFKKQFKKTDFGHPIAATYASKDIRVGGSGQMLRGD
jgi:hypothetical protein